MTPLTVTLTVTDEHWFLDLAQPEARAEVTIRVQHGAWQTQTREVLEVSRLVPLFDSVMARLTSVVRQRWLADHGPDTLVPPGGA
jgi:hypothetical protein